MPLISSPSTVKDDAICLEAQAEDEEMLKRIDAALRRLETGRFGHCLYCGDPISMNRLKNNPAITSCSTCNED